MTIRYEYFGREKRIIRHVWWRLRNYRLHKTMIMLCDLCETRMMAVFDYAMDPQDIKEGLHVCYHCCSLYVDIDKTRREELERKFPKSNSIFSMVDEMKRMNLIEREPYRKKGLERLDWD